MYPTTLLYTLIKMNNMKEEKEIIMYDSGEAASKKTLTGWVSGGKGGYPSHYYGDDEHMARWAGCTHLKCECGNIMSKSYTKCEECRHKKSSDYYMSLPFKEWDFKEYVVEWDGDKYFFSLEELEDYMQENEIEEIDLLFCEPIEYSMIDSEDLVNGNAHEDWEPSAELEKRIKELNDYLGTLPAHSYEPGKVRTNHKIKLEPTE